MWNFTLGFEISDVCVNFDMIFNTTIFKTLVETKENNKLIDKESKPAYSN